MNETSPFHNYYAQVLAKDDSIYHTYILLINCMYVWKILKINYKNFWNYLLETQNQITNNHLINENIFSSYLIKINHNYFSKY